MPPAACHTRAPTKDTAPVAFCWGHVADRTDRDWLERRTHDLVGLAYNRACDAVRMGEILMAVANRLPGHFVAWIEAKAPCSLSHAYRLMAAAKAFAPFVSQIEKVDASALYLLSHDRTPPGARAEAVRLAAAGERVTRRVALDLLDAHRPDRRTWVQSEIDFGDADHRRLNQYRTADGKVVNQQEITAAAEAQDAERLRKIGRAVVTLFEVCDMVTLSTVGDADDVTLYSVTAAVQDKPPKNVVDRDALRALQRAAGVVELKHCTGCCPPDAVIPTDRFGCNRRMPDD
jgi:hypothetical protein